jgi:hypothetical protein
MVKLKSRANVDGSERYDTTVRSRGLTAWGRRPLTLGAEDTRRSMKYRGHELDGSTVIGKLAGLTGRGLTQTEVRFVCLYLEHGTEGYRSRRGTYTAFPEYERVNALMAQFLLSLRAVRWEKEHDDTTGTGASVPPGGPPAA